MLVSYLHNKKWVFHIFIFVMLCVPFKEIPLPTVLHMTAELFLKLTVRAQHSTLNQMHKINNKTTWMI